MSIIAQIKELTGQGKTVKFVQYEKGVLVYATDCGFEFGVPVKDCGDGVFLAQDKASMFRRYIRMELNKIEDGKKEAEDYGEEG